MTAMDDEFLSTYDAIKTANKATISNIETAIEHEENERPEDALKFYKISLEQIREIFAIPVGLPNNMSSVKKQWLDACQIIQHLHGAKSEILYRIKVLERKCYRIDEDAIDTATTIDDDNNMEPVVKKKFTISENPVTHYDITSGDGTSKTYSEIKKGLRKVLCSRECLEGVHFDTIFQAPSKFYEIQPNGVVSTLAGSGILSLIMCTTEVEALTYLNGITFMQYLFEDIPTTTANSNHNTLWVYPLIPHVVNSFRTDYGAFIFPDIGGDTPGKAFGIMLIDPKTIKNTEKPNDQNIELEDLQQFFLDLLEAILTSTIEELKQLPQQPTIDTSTEVSLKIVKVADFIAQNLVRGAEKTGDIMMKSTPYIMSKMDKAPADAPPVSNAVQNTVEVAKTVTSAAASVTGWVAGKVGTASLALGRYLAPHIQNHGATLLQKGFGYDTTEANSKMEGAMTIAAGAVEGFSTVYNGLDTSAKILGSNLSENSVKIIEHKYGQSAGNVAAGTFDTIGNAYNVSQNVNYITPKGIAKKMAKNTGKAVVDDYKQSLRNNPNNIIPAGTLYPDLREFK